MKAISICFVLCFSFVFYSYSQSQYIKAGVYNSADDIYRDVIPDDSVPMTGTGMYSLAGYCLIDVNEDGFYDFKFTSNFFGAMGGGSSSFFIEPIDTIKGFIVSQIDSCLVFPFPNTKKGYTVPVKLNFGDSIYSNSSYFDNEISYIKASGYGGWVYPTFNSWQGIGERYIGFKLLTIGDALFGWIRVEVFASGKVAIKDYACNKTNYNVFSVYPNPADTQILIITEGLAGQIKLYNMLGDLVMSIPITSNDNSYTISTSILPGGVYILSLDDGKNIKSKKIIVHHDL